MISMLKQFICPLFVFFLSASFAAAHDLSTLQKCIDSGYGKMIDRNGIVVAVLDANNSEITTFGAASKDQIFEIGSITKTFTGNLLAQSILAGSHKLVDPIPAVYQKSPDTITFQQLTTHTSGITPNFADYQSPDPLSPFSGLTVSIFKTLYEKTTLKSTPGQTWNYSNIAVSLLGLILAEDENISYSDLVQKKILIPLTMNETFFRVPSELSARFPRGNVIINKNPRMPAPYWDLYDTAVNPAGGIRSTVSDMILYARSNLHPEIGTLSDAMKLTQQPLFKISSELSNAMNWFVTEGNILWHHGATAGFNSIIAISKKQNQAIVAMTDTASYIIDANGTANIDPSFQDVALNCLK